MMDLKMNSVTKKFNTVTALKKVNITFRQNAITGLIGFNGSGKTTSFNVLTNLIEKYEGSVTINDGQTTRPVTRRDRILFSYLAAGSEPQNSEKVMHHLYYLGSLHGLSRAKVRAQTTDLVHVLDFSSQMNKQIKALSKGNQQKIKLISSFLNPNTKYLFLDEPFDGLDPIMTEKVKQFILKRRSGLTIIITSHRLEIVDQMCDCFYILKNGVLVETQDRANLDQDQTVIMAVNREVAIDRIKKISDVLAVKQNNQETIITGKNIKSIKKINQKLILDPKYIWSSYRPRKLTESVFERYADDGKK